MKKIFALITAVFAFVAAPVLANETKAGKANKTDYYFSKMDTNGDNMISREESNAFSASQFEAADTNKDSMLSRDELMAHKKKEHEKHASLGSQDAGDYKDNSAGNK